MEIFYDRVYLVYSESRMQDDANCPVTTIQTLAEIAAELVPASHAARALALLAGL